MSLDIGGAETHIYELARGLAAKGHEITVFSNGGIYADALEKAGIRHVKTPLNSKAPSALMKSLRILKREFKKNRPSVVHSHTRLSNLVGGWACRSLGIPMVTTVHGSFSTGFLMRRLSNWGDRALAVSEDLKSYLVDNYNYDPDKVDITVNGVDMQRFAKRDLPEFKASLGVKPEQKIILMVSRMDADSGDHIERFLKIAPEIFSRCPDARLVIVGDGQRFEEFRETAESINSHFDAELVLLQGAKSNIDQYTAVADLFVGISRSALEAMSSSVPVILLGNNGYLGLYSDSIREECILTNLTCRGYDYPMDSELAELAVSCLTDRDLSKNISDGLKLVREQYSIEKMAQTAQEAYCKASDEARPYDYMVSGYYGYSNFGDDITLKKIVSRLNGRRGTVLTRSASKTDVPDGVGLLQRFDFFGIFGQMKKTKVFLMGSGSILQDVTSGRSFNYYSYMLKKAHKYHCKTLLYANGIGPIRKKRHLHKTKEVLNLVDVITVRDIQSKRFIDNLLGYEKAVLTADEGFRYTENDYRAQKPIAAAEGKTIVGVNLRPDVLNRGSDFDGKADFLADIAKKHNLFFYLIPLHYSQDYPVLSRLNRRLPDCSYLPEARLSNQELMSLLGVGRVNILERLHGQIISSVFGVPFLPVSYDPKTQELAAAIGLDRYMIISHDFDISDAESKFERLLADRDNIVPVLADYTHKAREKADMNTHLLVKLIESY